MKYLLFIVGVVLLVVSLIAILNLKIPLLPKSMHGFAYLTAAIGLVLILISLQAAKVVDKVNPIKKITK